MVLPSIVRATAIYRILNSGIAVWANGGVVSLRKLTKSTHLIGSQFQGALTCKYSWSHATIVLRNQTKKGKGAIESAESELGFRRKVKMMKSQIIFYTFWIDLHM